MATLSAITGSLIFKIILLIVGFVLLIKGADFFVEGSSSVAKKLKVPPLIIGMTIVAMGTSLPEAAVSVSASMNDANSLAVSNVVGSNIFNLMMVLGICALFNKLKVGKDVLKRDYPFSIICGDGQICRYCIPCIIRMLHHHSYNKCHESKEKGAGDRSCGRALPCR